MASSIEKDAISGTAGRSTGEASIHILHVAASLFAERGYDATSVREIVEAAGVTKPTLYYHFGSKHGLVEALVTRPMSEFLARLRGLLDQPIAPIELLRRTLEAHVALIADEPDRGRFLFAICFGPGNSSLQAEMHHFGLAIDEVTAECSARLAEAGLIASERVGSCSQAIRGLIMSATLDHVMLGKPLEPRLAERLVDDLLGGFGRPGFKSQAHREGS